MPRNIAEFRIIGQVGGVDAKDKVTYVNVASNYNRQVDGEWQEDTHWNRVTCFGRCAEYAGNAGKGDMVHITGRVRQTSYEREGATIYGTDLVADSFSVLNRAGGGDAG
ncbi:single-stranded DNA-binding protein [Sphingobium sp. AP50]|uniref:single-stranded DNA-binding protein n=1 Tax=Sphingobium sp. AP50 TaxID=1884369 RepID=UPI000B851182|nr:single-stranded DNA-binding protein [Sphingobium sp. AP50]